MQDALLSDFHSDRFQVLRQLGSGSFGVVYEAVDRTSNSVVALKLLKNFTADSLYRFKREFRALADLEHPNLIRFGELHCDSEQWFFTMELVKGTDILSHVRTLPVYRGNSTTDLPSIAEHGDRELYEDGAPALSEALETMSSFASSRLAAPTRGGAQWKPKRKIQAGGFDVERTRNAFAQLAAAIHELHESGRVHCDVKPRNALVNEAGRVVLLDFGLIDEMSESMRRRSFKSAPALDDMCHSSIEMIIGTPAYMAPEQIEQEPLDPAVDWYAFGVMLFRAMTGYLPFMGTIADILRAKTKYDGPAPSDWAEGIPEELDRLCHELLRRAPADRPTGADILRRLGVVAPASGEEVPDHVFVGRDDELSALRQAFSDAQAGETVATLVCGEPGVGKSALVSQFLDALTCETDGSQQPSLAVVSGRCYEQESVPFRAFDSVVDSLSHFLLYADQTLVDTVVSEGAQFAADVFPVLKRVPAIADGAREAALVGEFPDRRRQAFRQLKAMLTALAQRVTLIVFIDDLQWADDDSLALLRFIFDGSRVPRCLFLATVRVGESSIDVPQHIAAVVAGHRTVQVGSLSEQQSRELVDRLMVGVTHERGAVDAVVSEADGHPLFLAELARYALRHDAHITEFHLQEVLWRRIADLDDEARRFMEYAAFIGVPFDISIVARAADIPADDTMMLVSGLRKQHLLRVSRSGGIRVVEPYHDRVREAVRDHVISSGVERQLAMHLQVGRAIVAYDGELGGRLFSAIKHLRLALDLLSNDERISLARLHLQAGHRSRDATAYDAMFDYFRQGLSLLGDGAWDEHYELTRDFERGLMEAEYATDRPKQARQRFATLLARVRTAAERVELYVANITSESGKGFHEQAISCGRAALAELGMPLPQRATTLAVLREYVGVRLALRGRQVDEVAGYPEMEDETKRAIMRILMTLAPPAYFTDSVLLTVALLRMARISVRFGLCDVSSYGFVGFGLALAAAFGKFEEAHAFGQLAKTLDERYHNRSLTAKLAFVHGTYLMPYVRPLAEARDATRDARELARVYGDVLYEGYAAATLTILTYVHAPPLPEILEEDRTSVAVLRRGQDVDMTAVAEVHLRYAEIMSSLSDDGTKLDRPDSPETEITDQLSPEKTPSSLFNLNLVKAELEYHFGDVEAARGHIEEADKHAHGAFGIPNGGELRFVEILVRARWAEEDASRRRAARRGLRRNLKQLAAWAKSCPSNYQAMHLIASAEFAWLRGQPQQAVSQLEQAIEVARTHGSLKREAVAHELLAQHARASGAGDVSAHLRAAIDAYRRWGAVRKVDALEQKFASELSE